MDTFFLVPLEPEETHEPRNYRGKEQDLSKAPRSIAKITSEETRYAI